MKIAELINLFEQAAPPVYQESYDNAGLLTGSPTWECTGALITLDVTEAVVQEAIDKKCNLIVAHHPIIFSGLKKLTGRNYVEKTVIAAIRHDIAIYAIHTNLDNMLNGVNGRIADLLGLTDRSALAPKAGVLKKLFSFVPPAHLDKVRDAIFAAGAGVIGKYSESAFASPGTGSFKAEQGARPFVGQVGKRHYEEEVKIEFVFPGYLQNQVIEALVQAHPYEEVAYDIMELANPHPGIGSGLIGSLPEPMEEARFLTKLREVFAVPVIKHTALTGRPVVSVAVCGGAGSFLISKALAACADFYVTSDLKYHEFFDANGKMVLADPGHFESEQFTIDLLYDILREKFPTFAVQKTAVRTNPVHYSL